MILDCPISVQSKTTAEDNYGADIPAYTEAFKTVAKKISTGEREFYSAQKIFAETTAVYKIRAGHKATITTTMQIVESLSGKTYDIVGINDADKRKGWILISVKERV